MRDDHTRSRRGSQAVEFALVLPLLLVMGLAVADYGWYFYRESRVMNAMRDAAKQGASQAPGSVDAANGGGCVACESHATAKAGTYLGVSSGNFHADVISLDGGTTCALQLTTSLDHQQFGLIPILKDHAVGDPDFDITVVAVAPFVTDCT